MLRFPGIFGRFRRLLAPPGPPAESLGVPAAGDDVAAELGPLLAEMEAVGAQADRIEQEARAEAERRRDRGISQAAAIVEEARGRADAERARAASRTDGAAREGIAAVRRQAEIEAQRIRGGVEDRLAQAVAEVLECVRGSGR
ncbi:MAG: hypothetical protein ACLGI5_03830 [Thermoleophilia bacterium]